MLITSSATHRTGLHCVCRGRDGGNHGLRLSAPQCPQQPVNDWVLFVAERRGIDRCEPLEDCECGNLRLCLQPFVDRGQMWIELGRNADACLVAMFRLAMRGAHSPEFTDVPKERAKASGSDDDSLALVAACRPRFADALAEFVLGGADFGQQRHRIKGAIALAQSAPDGLRQPRHRVGHV